MPKFHAAPGIIHEYAQEQEVLDFARALREAGNADTLDALMPSQQNNSESCLIANALNFKSAVLPLRDDPSQGIFSVPPAAFDDQSVQWVMVLPNDVDATKLGAAVGCDVIEVFYEGRQQLAFNRDVRDGEDGEVHYLSFQKRNAIKLPQRIGNAANAFDRSEGWTAKYTMYVSSPDATV